MVLIDVHILHHLHAKGVPPLREHWKVKPVAPVTDQVNIAKLPLYAAIAKHTHVIMNIHT